MSLSMVANVEGRGGFYPGSGKLYSDVNHWVSTGFFRPSIPAPMSASKEVKPEEIKPDKVKYEELPCWCSKVHCWHVKFLRIVKTEEVKHEEIKPEEIKPEKVQPEKVPCPYCAVGAVHCNHRILQTRFFRPSIPAPISTSEEVTPEKVTPEDLKPKEKIARAEKVKPEQVEPEEVTPEEASSSSLVLDCFQLVEYKLRQELTKLDGNRQSQGLRFTEPAQPFEAYKSQGQICLESVAAEEPSKQHLLEQPATYLNSLYLISGQSNLRSQLSFLALWLSRTPLLCSISSCPSSYLTSATSCTSLQAHCSKPRDLHSYSCSSYLPANRNKHPHPMFSTVTMSNKLL